MVELLEAVASWWSLVLVLVGFGFAPGFCLRLIVLAYPRGDPRRAELVAELYAVPRIQRPVWVAEQLEVALFEGLEHRVSAAIRRLTDRRRARGRTDQRSVRVRVYTRCRDLVLLVLSIGSFVATGFALFSMVFPWATWASMTAGVLSSVVAALATMLIRSPTLRSRRDRTR